MRLARQGDVFLLDLGDGENRFDPALLDAASTALDAVERHEQGLAVLAFWSPVTLDVTALRPDDAAERVLRQLHVQGRSHVVLR